MMSDLIRFENPTLDPVIINGKIESYYIVFQQDRRAADTLHFYCSDGSRARVDVDGMGTPIALEMITQLPVSGQKPEHEPDSDAFYKSMFLFAVGLVRGGRNME